MDPTLAALYGTAQVDDADLEKAASAELAEGLADEGDASLADLTEEDVEALAQEVLDENGGAEDTEEGAEKVAGLDDAEFLVADRMGRVMAHAFHAENAGIAKEAGKVGDALRSAGRAVKKVPGKVGKHLEGVGKGATRKVMRTGGAEQAMNPRTAKRIGGGVYGAGAAAAGAAGFGAKKALEKRSSAVETLVEQRAREILAANGIDVDGQEKQANAREALNQVVDARAVELLQNLGYSFEE